MTERSLSKVECDLNTAFALWHIYEQTRRTNKNLLNKLIARAESVLEATENFDENTKIKHEEFICICKNDLAYYLAERKDPKDKERVRAYLEDIIEKRKKYPRFAFEWVHTCDFIKKQFPDIKILC